MADIKPLYRKTLGQAKMLGEIGDWRESFRENIACARAIDATIQDGYDGMHLREGMTGSAHNDTSALHASLHGAATRDPRGGETPMIRLNQPQLAVCPASGVMRSNRK